MSHPIPSAALDDRLGFLGTSGSGKTYNAGVAVERLLSKKARVVIVDPLGVWWGLRLTADGKHASPYNVVIFGGPRGDLPLTEHAGALIGETAATMAESCILDLRELGSKAAERRFMTAFLETLYRKASGEPFHLVVDEADLFAPQKPAGGDETLLGHMENIVRRGRVKGFIPWLISQRPAVLNKNVLSQVDGLLAFKLTASQDRDALDSWIEGQADKAQGKAIKDALPTLQIGQGVVWLPGRSVLTTAKFPQKETFDSSRTPKRGEKVKRTAALKPLDLSSLKGRLVAVESEAKANDPKKLRAEISTLLAQKAALEKLINQDASKQMADNATTKAAEKRGFERAKTEAIRNAKAHVAEALAAIQTDVDQMNSTAKGAIEVFRMATAERLKALMRDKDALKPIYAPPPEAAPRPTPTVAPRSPSPAKPATPIVVPGQLPTGEGFSDGRDGSYEQKLLNALAELRALGVTDPARELVALMARYSLHTNKVKAAIVALKNDGLIEYGTGTLKLTDAGSARAIPVDVPRDAAEMRARITAILGEPTDKLLAHLTSIYPEDCTREELAAACGYSIHTNKVKAAIVKLKDMGFMTYPSQGRVRADASLFF
ncbi:DUF87 domain-containing protein [Pseudolabrys taiwanensis]|uniref:DUF87 domain-containing protein n=1 Tax=Pseudolabrys taiwanensis TaxID=331696 RepID=A0A345ZSS7_9HYPH|nr:DUF87 domain-containing protein [Pseudolabrys taiwanensis]AXK79974.1 DUF87 domain-containing protein [Pseudolabrys taiwanensis]